jgi:putative membrane protein
MVFQTNKRRGFCIDTMCADDTLSPDALDSPRTLEYAQTESKEIMTDYTDDGTGTYTGTYAGTMNGTVDQTLSAGENSVNIENQWTLDQNWTQEEVNKVLGNNHHYRPILEKTLTGNISDGVRVQKEVRSIKKKAPANAWLPNRNLEILALLVIYNLGVVMAAAFTPFCGNEDANDPYSFCNEKWVLVNGDFLLLIGVAIFFFLAFRVNVSIHRRQECSRHLNRIESACRNLVRQICFHVSIIEDKEAWERRRAISFIKAFPFAVKLQLRKERNAVPDLGNILVHQDILNLIKSNSMSQFCIDNISYFFTTAVTGKRLSEASLASIETSSLTPMVEAMSALQAIRSTPVPSSYVFHIKLMIIVWLLAVPLHLVVNYGFVAIFFCFLIDYILLGMESVACEFEMPLGYDKNDLDLDAVCVQLSQDLEEILVRVEHQGRDLIFDTWEVSRNNEVLIYRATSEELDKLTSNQKVAKQGRAQLVRAATKGFDKSSDTDQSGVSNV